MTVTGGITLGSAQTLGNREEQQDALGFSDKNDGIFVEHGGVLALVADGVGGHAHGREASHIAVEAFLREYKAKPRVATIRDALYQALIEANRRVFEFAQSQGEVENCGTTLVAVALHPDTSSLHWISVGDSRLYFIRGNQLVQFTSDATYGNHLVKKVARGVLTRDGLSSEENTHKLTSVLGVKKLGIIDRNIRPFPLHEGDVVMLCTDGIYQTLDKGQLVECQSDEPQLTCDTLVEALLERNLEAQDNASVVILGYGFKPSQVNSTNANANKQQERLSKQDDPVHPRPLVKTSRWVLWGVMAFGLLMILALVWLGYKEDQFVEESKPGKLELPVTNKPVINKQIGPHKPRQKR